MTTNRIEGDFILRRRIHEASRGKPEAFFELGIAYAAGTDGAQVDYIEAHKWFNLAALSGDERGQQCRAELSEEMSARDVAQAQRLARAWMADSVRCAA